MDSFPQDWNVKVGNQQLPGITGKFGLGLQNEAGKRLTEFCQENTLVIENSLFQQHMRYCTHEYHQMVNTETRLIILFPAKDGEVLHSQQKQDWELTVAQIMNLLIAKFRLKWKKVGKNIRPSSMT